MTSNKIVFCSLFRDYRWICAFLTIASDSIDATEFIEVDTNLGQVLLIRPKNPTELEHTKIEKHPPLPRAYSWNAIRIRDGAYVSSDDFIRDVVICDEYGCRDGHLTEITVRKMYLNEVPSEFLNMRIFHDLMHLQMSGMGMTEFNISLRGPNALNSLNISHNSLTKLASYAFATARKLSSLDLSYNQISTMGENVFNIPNDEKGMKEPDSFEMSFFDTFPQFKNLEIIRLDHNNLTYVDHKWFANLSALKELTLNDNFLVEIIANMAFGGNFRLRELSLENNNFTSIDFDLSWQESNILNSFNISNNPNNQGIQVIRIDARWVDISRTNSAWCYISKEALIMRAEDNRITDFDLTDLAALNEAPRLEELHLAHNLIRSLRIIANFGNLRKLDVSYNQIPTVDRMWFGTMNDLTELNMSHNLLTAIDFDFLVPLVRLTHFDISSNLLFGHFNFSVRANALRVLNIADNKFTSVQSNLKRLAPNLATIDLNDNQFDCQTLTSMLLFMHFDRITPNVRDGDATEDGSNVKGIKCKPVETSTTLTTDRSKASEASRSFSTSEVMKNEIIKSFDDKLSQLEYRLMQALRNISTPTYVQRTTTTEQPNNYYDYDEYK